MPARPLDPAARADRVDRIRRIEAICAEDVGRGVEPLANAAAGGLAAAAGSIADHEAPSVAILTGFLVRGVEAAETDGPVGAAQLARGLSDAAVPVRVVTDEPCRPVLEAALQAASCTEGVALDVLPADASPEDLQGTLEAWERGPRSVTHVVSVERVGPAADGRCYNMRGEDISEWTAPLDGLFTENRIRIGIGDGGNELGMGSLPRRLVEEAIARGERIACAVSCDHLVVCGVSNWGAWGLIAGLALLRPEWREALFESLEQDLHDRVLLEMVEKGGAVDGLTRESTPSVDGVVAEVHARVLAAVRAAIDSADLA